MAELVVFAALPCWINSRQYKLHKRRSLSNYTAQCSSHSFLAELNCQAKA